LLCKKRPNQSKKGSPGGEKRKTWFSNRGKNVRWDSSDTLSNYLLKKREVPSIKEKKPTNKPPEQAWVARLLKGKAARVTGVEGKKEKCASVQWGKKERRGGSPSQEGETPQNREKKEKKTASAIAEERVRSVFQLEGDTERKKRFLLAGERDKAPYNKKKVLAPKGKGRGVSGETGQKLGYLRREEPPDKTRSALQVEKKKKKRVRPRRTVSAIFLGGGEPGKKEPLKPGKGEEPPTNPSVDAHVEKRGAWLSRKGGGKGEKTTFAGLTKPHVIQGRKRKNSALEETREKRGKKGEDRGGSQTASTRTSISSGGGREGNERTVPKKESSPA